MKILNEQDAVEDAQDKKSFQTICKNCVFANVLSNDNENQDDYCHIPGRMGSFEEKGAEILNVHDPDHEGKNYKIINNRVCNMMRTDLWQEIQGVRNQEAYISKDRDRLVKIARDEIRAKCAFVIYMDNEEGERSFIEDERMDSLAQTMKDIDSGIIAPGEIVVVNNCGIKPHNFIMRLRNRVKKLEIKCKWKMEYILENDRTREEVLNDAIESVVKTSKNNHYIAIFFDGDRVPENYLSDIDSAINDSLLKFIALCPENKESLSGMFFQKLSCSIVGGQSMEKETESEESDVKINFLENLIKLSEQQECQELIKPLKSVVKNL